MKPFPWRRGMTAIDERGERWLIVESDGKNWAQCRPDPNDGATKGALLDVVRKAWGFPDLYPRRISEGRRPHVWSVTPPTGHEPPFREGWGFVVGCAKGQELARRVGIQPSEFAALLAAWEAAP